MPTCAPCRRIRSPRSASPHSPAAARLCEAAQQPGQANRLAGAGRQVGPAQAQGGFPGAVALAAAGAVVVGALAADLADGADPGLGLPALELGGLLTVGAGRARPYV